MKTPRVLFGAALGLAAASCAVGTGPSQGAQIQVLPSVPVAVSNQMAASSIMQGSVPMAHAQVASLQPVTSAAPMVKQGKVLWHREETPEEVQQRAEVPLREKVSELVELQGQTQAQLGQAQAQLVAMRKEQAEQEQKIRAEALSAVTSVAQMSQQALQATTQAEANLKTFAEARAVQESRRAAAESKVFTAEQLAQANANLKTFAEARAVQESRRAAEESKVFTAEQLAQVNANTAQVLAQSYKQANLHAEKVAAAKAGEVAAKVDQLAENTSSGFSSMAQTTSALISDVELSSVKRDEARAIALQSVQDSKDYIKTVTRNTVQDQSDPAMSQALASAAGNAIIKDDKVVFAIRRAIAEELQTVAQAKANPGNAVTRLGTDRADAGEVIDSKALTIAGLLSPDADMAEISPAAGTQPITRAMLESGKTLSGPASLRRASSRSSWMDIRQYKVIVHEDNKPLPRLIENVLADAEPFVGPWQLKWRISDENKGILREKFSIDAETTFDDFLSYLGQYVMNDRGVKLSFSLFDAERVIVISD